MQLVRYKTHMVRCLLERFFTQNTARLLLPERTNERSKVFGSMRGAAEQYSSLTSAARETDF